MEQVVSHVIPLKIMWLHLYLLLPLPLFFILYCSSTITAGGVAAHQYHLWGKAHSSLSSRLTFLFELFLMTLLHIITIQPVPAMAFRRFLSRSRRFHPHILTVTLLLLSSLPTPLLSSSLSTPLLSSATHAYTTDEERNHNNRWTTEREILGISSFHNNYGEHSRDSIE